MPRLSGRFCLESDLAGSRWCTRGWTLQELITPETVIFFNKDWEQLGTKQSLGESTLLTFSADLAVLNRSASLKGCRGPLPERRQEQKMAPTA